MTAAKLTSLASSYDRIADDYVRRIYGELAHKPLDRQLLDEFADRTRGHGVVCELGCGPGHVARYLHERGVAICGVDLSQEMVKRALALNPGIEFYQGDMRQLAFADDAWAGIVAFYSIVHIPHSELTTALSEWRRVLRPGGLVLLAFHVGDETVHYDELWSHEVSLDFVLFRPDQVASSLREAGFNVERSVERDPYPDVEHPSRRAYLFATTTEV